MEYSGSKEEKERIHYGNFEANKKFLNKVGLPQKEDRVLEIGCGKGGMLYYLITEGYEAEGVEKSQEHIERANRIYGNLPIKKVDGVELPYESNTFDVVMSFDVLEHIPNTDGHLKEVGRVLKVGRSYLLQSPNKWTNSIFATVRWRSLKWRRDHCSLHSYYQFIRRFRKNGFSVKFYDIPVVNEYFREKIYRNIGYPGILALKFISPDMLPIPLKTNFYMKAKNKNS
jgi:SAM-dependent methyltransferase